MKSTQNLICFDLDGVIISSMVIANQLFYDTVEEVLNLPTEDYRKQKQLMALSAEERIETLWPEASLTQDQMNKVLELYRQRKMAVDIPLLPHAKEAVSLMAEHFEFMACVSNNPNAIIEQTLAEAGLLHYFSKLSGIDHLQFSKPHPEIYASTVNYFGLEPKNCLTFEDSTAGVTSAKGAGMKVIGVTTGLEEKADLEKAGVDMVLGDLSELRLEMVVGLLG